MQATNSNRGDAGLSDEEWLKAEYRRRFGREADLHHPVSFNEKLQVYKLTYRQPLLTSLADKYQVREFVADQLGDEFLIPLLGCYRSVGAIPVDQLPDQFIIKATHGSGWNLICTDKSSLDWESARSRLRKWLKTDFSMRFREWAYRDIPPRIVIERLLLNEDGAIPVDYKFFCFGGEPKLVQVDVDRLKHHTRAMFDLDWNRLPFSFQYPLPSSPIAAPAALGSMLEVAAKLSKGLPFVRVDLYAVRSRIYFGEMTFYPEAGFGAFDPPEWDDVLGRWFTIAGLREEKQPAEAGGASLSSFGRDDDVGSRELIMPRGRELQGSVTPRSALNLVFFSHSGELGGSELSLLELVTELIQDHAASCTVYLPGQGPLAGQLEQVGAAVIIGEYSRWCAPGTFSPEAKIDQEFGCSLDWVLGQLNELRRIDPDIIVSNTLTIPWGAVAAALLDRPHVWRVSEFGELDHGLTFYRPFTEVTRFIEEASNKVVVCSQAVGRELFAHPTGQDFETIYASVKVPPRTPAGEGQQYFFRARATRLLMLGSIIESKGQEDAVAAAINLVKAQGQDIELVLMGVAHPEYLGFLQRMISGAQVDDRVHILPYQPDVFSVLGQADIVLLCSRQEAFARVVIEAMLMQKPVVATSSGGTTELIRDGKTGLLYAPGNVPQLTSQIRRLIDEPGLRERLAQAAFTRASAQFTRANFGGRFHELFMRLRQAGNPLKAGGHEMIHQFFLSSLRQKDHAVRALSIRLRAQQEEVRDLRQQHAEKAHRAQVLVAQLHRSDRALRQIQGSRAWRLIALASDVRRRLAAGLRR